MFEYLSDRKLIMVTGPQRSGTRICSHMIAYDLPDHKLYDEADIHYDSLYSLKDHIGRLHIVQCPALMYAVHAMPKATIVVMRRSVAEIEASMKRINWPPFNEIVERFHYNRYHEVSDAPVAILKYDYWERFQKPITKDYIEIEYSSLASHPLWKPKEERQSFTWNQTE